MRTLGADVVQHVIYHLYKIVVSVPYFLSLRTVSREFNEIVLHVLFIKGQHPNVRYGPLHAKPTIGSKWCRDNWCPEVECWSSHASTYAQLYLSGQIAARSTRCERRAVVYRHLEEAGAILEEVIQHVSSRHALFSVDVSRVNVLSENSTFQNTARGLVCKAAAFFLTNRMIMNDNLRLRPYGIENEKASFWVVNVACYLGREHLANYVLGPEFAEKYATTVSELQRSASKCLAIAIERGHQRVADKILRFDPMAMAGRRDAPCPFRAAIRACNITLVRKWYDYYGGLGQGQIDEALSDEEINPKKLMEYAEIFSLLWQTTNPQLTVLQSSITSNAARTGSVGAINILAANKALSSTQLQLTGNDSALTRAAQNGHLDCLIALFENRYLENANRGNINRAAEEAATGALQNNHLDIFQELKRRLDCFKRPLWFVKLAAAEGAVPLMQEYIEDDPQLLQHRTKEYLKYVYKLLHNKVNDRETDSGNCTIGQAALEQAIKSLRYENVLFLLGLNVRLSRYIDVVHIPWIKYTANKEAFEATQQVLLSYNLPVFSEAV